MSIIKKILLLSVLMTLSLAASAEEIKKIGKFKDWEAMVLVRDSGITCFAQSKPVLQAPKTNKRDARLFVSFRPNEKIKDEISITPGYEFNKKNSIFGLSEVTVSKNKKIISHVDYWDSYNNFYIKIPIFGLIFKFVLSIVKKRI